MSYKPKCDRCEHYKSCAIQKRLAELYQELWNINREKCGRTDGFVDGHYVKDIADIPSADVVERKAHEKVVEEISKRRYAEGKEQARLEYEGKIKIADNERKRGEWTYNLEQGDPISIECPLCGATIYISGDIPDDENYLITEDYNYCPNCGADMRGNDK